MDPATSNALTLRFGGEVPWQGPYKEVVPGASQFKYVDKLCSICYGDFLPEDRLAVLPCGHGFHDRCFKAWPRQTCIMHRSFTIKIESVSLLDRTLVLPPKTLRFGSWMWKEEEPLKDLFFRWLPKILQKSQEQLQKAIADENERPKIIGIVTFFKVILEDCLNMYEGTFPNVDISQHIDMRLTEFSKFFRKSMSLEERAQIFSNGRLNAIQEEGNKILRNRPRLVYMLYKMGLPLPQEADLILGHVGRIFTQMGKHPNFLSFERERNHHFHLKHIKALRQADSTFAKYVYLFRLKREDFELLSRLTKGAKGPASQLIQNVNSKLDTARKIKKPLLIGCSVATFYVVLAYWLYSVFKEAKKDTALYDGLKALDQLLRSFGLIPQ